MQFISITVRCETINSIMQFIRDFKTAGNECAHAQKLE